MDKTTNRFLELFYEITRIPRQSGKEKEFADFLETFAKQNKLDFYRDNSNNVLIKKNGNKKNNEPIILQAHIDMVCVKRENSKHNFETDKIEIVRNGDEITAKDTSLGADQGIGLAIMLLILESQEIKHPDIECLFTTEEETTFKGVINFDYTKLKGKKLINLDHCKDNSIVIGSDADICNRYTFKGNLENNNMPTYEIKISGIAGGNSGVEIERSNVTAIKIFSELVQELQKEDEVFVCSINGGTSEGDIATSCKCVLKTNIEEIENKIRKIYKQKEIEVNKADSNVSFSLENSKKIINQILNLKQGVIETNDTDIVSSGNLGIIRTENNEIYIDGILRSIDVDKLQKYNEENILCSKNNNFVTTEIYRDPLWRPNPKSDLNVKYKNSYYKLNGEYPNNEICHSALECSCISNRMKNIEMISIGSIIENFHTVDEKMYVSSCEKTIKTLLEYLKCEE